jgi:phage gpG-like protein
MISLKIKFPDLAGKFASHQKEILGVLAATMQTNRAMMFDKDGADNGKKKWDKPVFRRGRPLQDSGALRKSFAPVNDGKKPAHSPNGILQMAGNSVKIGTTLAYATLMNDGTVDMPGGVLKAVNAKALKIPLPSGENATPGAKKLGKSAHTDDQGNKFMFRHSVKIPARKMDEITKADEKEWADTLANYIAEVLNAG